MRLLDFSLSLNLLRAAAVGIAVAVGVCSPARAQPQPQELVPEGIGPGAHFGAAVAASANTIVVGAPDALLGNTPSSTAFVFEAQGGVWSVTAAFNTTGPAADGRLGAAVAVDGDVIVVGAPGTGGGQGAAYILERSGGLWSETATLSPSATPQQAFGTAVAISGAVVVVASADNDPVSVFRRQGDAWALVSELRPGGAVTQASLAAIAVNGATIAATGTSQSGTAVFGYESQDGGASWQEAGQFGPATDANSFGVSLALGTDTLLIGATTPGMQDSGRVYLYSQSSGPNVVEFAPGDGQSGFGAALAVAGEVAVIGAPQSDVGQNAEQGAAIVRAQNQDGPNGWGVVTTLVGPNGAAGDHFGAAVAVGALNVVVGAPQKNAEAGAAYVYLVEPGGPNEPQPTAVATGTPRPVFDDDGCAVTPSTAGGNAGFILLLVPALLALLRR